MLMKLLDDGVLETVRPREDWVKNNILLFSTTQVDKKRKAKIVLPKDYD